MQQIDTQGLSCPEPVIRACRAVNELNTGEKITIIVEAGAPRENVLRAVRNLGYEASAVEHENCIHIVVIKK